MPLPPLSSEPAMIFRITSPALPRPCRKRPGCSAEVPGAIAFLLDEDFAYDQDTLDKVRNNEAAKNLLGELALAFNQVDDWSSSKEAIAATAKANGAKPGQLMFPTRVALSGQSGGPDLGAILEILGKDESIRRIRRTISQL